jgi:hypothetical protein
LIRSKRRDTPPGKPSIVSTGLTIILAADVTGRASRLGRRVGEFLGLAHLVELGQGVDLGDAHLEHVDPVNVERAEFRPHGEPGQESDHGDALIHGEVRALEQLRSDQVLRLEHGLRLETGLGPRGRRGASHHEDNDRR